MVRTKADAGIKASAAKAPRKGLAPSSSGCSSNSPRAVSNSSKDKYSGGNQLNPQPTPEWQKGITSFFKKKDTDITDEKDKSCTDKNDTKEGGSSSPKGDIVEKELVEGKDSMVEDSMDVDSPEDKENKSSFKSNGVISDDDD